MAYFLTLHVNKSNILFLAIVCILSLTNLPTSEKITYLLLAATAFSAVDWLRAESKKLFQDFLHIQRYPVKAASNIFNSTKPVVKAILILELLISLFIPFIIEFDGFKVGLSLAVSFSIFIVLFVTSSKQRSSTFYKKISKTLDLIFNFFKPKTFLVVYIPILTTTVSFKTRTLKAIYRPPILNLS